MNQAMLTNPYPTSETSPMLSLVVNGQPVEVHPGETVATLIEARQPRPPFAVELNKRLVRRSNYATTLLVQNDNIEIVTLVGGG